MASKYRGSGKKVHSAQVAYKGGINIETLAAGVTMDAQSSNLQILNPDGSNRTIVLPAEETNDGLWFSFRNSGSSGNLVITDDASSTILTLNPGESGTVGCDGSAWAKAFEGTPALADFGSTGMKTDVVAESTSGAGVTVDGLLIKDKQIDASGLATGEPGVKLPANKADAWSVYTSVGDLESWDTTTSAVVKIITQPYRFLDSVGAKFGTGDDIVGSWDGTRFSWTQATANSEMRYGADGAGIDQMWYGDTASAYLNWDQSADALIFGGVASARGLRTSSSTAAAITGATTLTLADSGGTFSVSQAAAYDIDLPNPTTGPGCRYLFYLTGPAANNVTITVDGAAATFVGTIVNDVTSVLPATGSTLTFASGVSDLGDTIEIVSISTTLYLVRAVTSANGGITVS